MTNYQTCVLIRLRAETDPARPILLDGYGKQYQQVRVESPHPIWRGTELNRGHFTVVEGAK